VAEIIGLKTINDVNLIKLHFIYAFISLLIGTLLRSVRGASWWGGGGVW